MLANKFSAHSFYIPVMGTGFTIDTPIAVAKYGISSVISLLDDVLIEQMRKCWCEKYAEPYEEITAQDEDARAKRITAYLNLLHRIIEKQIALVKADTFEPNSEITLYFEMLPACEIKQVYAEMLKTDNPTLKLQLQGRLRESIVAGSIDANIMTKLDRQHYRDGVALPYDFCDAAAALRGYANSNVTSTIVFSAGYNPNLYNYAAKFEDFFPDENDVLKKKICLKVSDFRSASVQGKYLAKHGLWVSEYRIESPLNCGGHAFINDGQLLGPILEEFKQRKNEFIESLHKLYKNALTSFNKFCSDIPRKIRLTAQGGVGTHEEHKFLMDYYGLDAVGWGTPFLLVPDATNVDTEHLEKLLSAESKDVFLSSSSPLGIPFWNLRNSASEEARLARIKNCEPGSICSKGFGKINAEFPGLPICMSSRVYQRQKLLQLQNMNLPPKQYAEMSETVLNKSCICHDLAGGATIKKGIDSKAAAAICPGPNIINFKQLMTLKEIIDHIYGRCSLLANKKRVHVFIREIQLQLDYLAGETKRISLGLQTRSQQKLETVLENLSKGIAYYQNLAKEVLREQQDEFLNVLQELQSKLGAISLEA